MGGGRVCRERRATWKSLASLQGDRQCVFHLPTRLLHVAVDDWLEGGGGKDLAEHIHRAFAIVAGVERDTPQRRKAAR